MALLIGGRFLRPIPIYAADWISAPDAYAIVGYGDPAEPAGSDT